jgi:hypothetical protein
MNLLAQVLGAAHQNAEAKLFLQPREQSPQTSGRGISPSFVRVADDPPRTFPRPMLLHRQRLSRANRLFHKLYEECLIECRN